MKPPGRPADSTHMCKVPESAAEVLLVDDEPHVVRLLALKLQAAGFAVRTASDGQAALEEVRRERPALVVTDLNMPRLDGLGLLRALAADPQLCDVPVVMLTGRGHTLPADALEIPQLIRVKRKPFSGRDVLALVQDVLGGGEAAAAA